MKDCEGCGAPINRGECCDYCGRAYLPNQPIGGFVDVEAIKARVEVRYGFGWNDPRNSLLRAGCVENDVNPIAGRRLYFSDAMRNKLLDAINRGEL